MFERTQDIKGKRFGRLTAVAPLRKVGEKVLYLFRCDCGRHKELRKGNVVSLRTTTCGGCEK